MTILKEHKNILGEKIYESLSHLIGLEKIPENYKVEGIDYSNYRSDVGYDGNELLMSISDNNAIDNYLFGAILTAIKNPQDPLIQKIKITNRTTFINISKTLRKQKMYFFKSISTFPCLLYLILEKKISKTTLRTQSTFDEIFTYIKTKDEQTKEKLSKMNDQVEKLMPFIFYDKTKFDTIFNN